MGADAITRRTLLARGAGGAALVAGGGLWRPPALGAQRRIRALPGAGAVRDDYQRMVDFGTRLTGTRPHLRFVDWLQEEFERAGCVVLPRIEHELDLWEAHRFGLDVLDGAAAGPVRVSAPFTRSGETPQAGIEARLVYGGVPPLPSGLATGDLAGLSAALLRYPEMLAQWARATLAGAGKIAGNIVLIDAPAPLPLTESFFYTELTAYNWSGHNLEPLRDYRRMFTGTIAMDSLLGALRSLGAVGAVFTADTSYANMAGQYLPFNAEYVGDIPALWVDRQVAERLRVAAAGTPRVRLTLEATHRKTTQPELTAILPGTSGETMIVNTHTDGQNAFEENGAVAQVHLARYFGSLPPEKRLRRSLVFSSVTGHMAGGPETGGWIEGHPDLVGCASAALTLEHFGCSEWVDSAAGGYYATGEAEMTALWTSQSGILNPTWSLVKEHDLPHVALLRPLPLHLGIGGAFWNAGVPEASFIAGPNYLVAIAENGHMDKLDADLAARQTRWSADLVRKLDGMTASALALGDAGLMRQPGGECKIPARPSPKTGDGLCLPGDERLATHGVGGVRLGATRARLTRLTVKPRRAGKQVLRWCVDGERGGVRAVLSGRGSKSRARLIASTAEVPGTRALKPGSSLRTVRKAFPRLRRVAPGVYRAGPRSNRLIGTRAGKLTYTAVADTKLLRSAKALRRYLRLL